MHQAPPRLLVIAEAAAVQQHPALVEANHGGVPNAVDRLAGEGLQQPRAQSLLHVHEVEFALARCAQHHVAGQLLTVLAQAVDRPQHATRGDSTTGPPGG